MQEMKAIPDSIILVILFAVGIFWSKSISANDGVKRHFPLDPIFKMRSNFAMADQENVGTDVPQPEENVGTDVPQSVENVGTDDATHIIKGVEVEDEDEEVEEVWQKIVCNSPMETAASWHKCCFGHRFAGKWFNVCIELEIDGMGAENGNKFALQVKVDDNKELDTRVDAGSAQKQQQFCYNFSTLIYLQTHCIQLDFLDPNNLHICATFHVRNFLYPADEKRRQVGCMVFEGKKLLEVL